jgi:hypothetical protein
MRIETELKLPRPWSSIFPGATAPAYNKIVIGRGGTDNKLVILSSAMGHSNVFWTYLLYEGAAVPVDQSGRRRG